MLLLLLLLRELPCALRLRLGDVRVPGWMTTLEQSSEWSAATAAAVPRQQEQSGRALSLLQQQAA